MSGRGVLVMVPTRSRPDNVKRFYTSWLNCHSAADLVFLNDQEASSLDGTIPLLPFDGGPLMTGNMFKNFHGDPTTVDKLNRTALQAVDRGYDQVMFIGDDHVIETRDWVRRLTEGLRARAFGNGWTYPADGRRTDIPEIVMISSGIVKALGWFALPAVKHTYIDHAWADLANEFDRLVWVPEVMIRHRHYRVDRDVPRDEVYDRGEAWAPRDGDAYLDWRDNGGRLADTGKLRSSGLLS
jgi:hypothetical protein